MDRVEIAVRFGDTLLEVSRIAHGETYLSPLTGKPLVESTPRGFAVGNCQLLAAPIAITSGAVTFTIARVGPAVPLPKRGMELRPLPFVAASLVAHVAMLIVALLLADPDPITVPVIVLAPSTRPVKLAKIDPPKPKPTKQQAKAAAAPAPPAVSELPPMTPAEARTAGIAGSASLDDLSMITGKADLAKALDGVGPVYDEDAANAQNFGGGAGRFRPEDDPHFASEKTGRYATIATGRGAGEHYKLPSHGKFHEVERPRLMALACDDNACVVEGTMDRFEVRDIIEKRYVDLVRCYERSATANPRVEITLAFEIGVDGRPSDVRSDGLDAVGSCVARIVSRTKFPESDQPTRVSRYPMAFWRNS